MATTLDFLSGDHSSILCNEFGIITYRGTHSNPNIIDDLSIYLTCTKSYVIIPLFSILTQLVKRPDLSPGVMTGSIPVRCTLVP